jgi:hypothetical protein
MFGHIRHLLILISALAFLSNAEIIERDFSSIPSNFVEAIGMLRQKTDIAEYLRNHNQVEYDPFEANSFIKENFIQLANAHQTYSASPFGVGLPNVTQGCMVQLLQFAAALQTSQSWASQVVDAFGKPQSGIFWGSLTWTGEYQECINITALGNWTGKYCSLAKPVDPMQPPGPGSVVKLKATKQI